MNASDRKTLEGGHVQQPVLDVYGIRAPGKKVRFRSDEKDGVPPDQLAQLAQEGRRGIEEINEEDNERSLSADVGERHAEVIGSDKTL